MKLFAILVIALVAQSYAYSSFSDFDESSDYDNSNSWSDSNRYPMSDSYSTKFTSSASRLPEAQFYKRKIIQRLAGSHTFSKNPVHKEKLINVADEKLENCKTPSGQKLDKHCLGRAIGQVMQLIATVENNDRQSGARDSNVRLFDY
uniref:Putative secreted protein n=1 Tax=Haematobia irritans TaxID=7368 RepID=A0A1L8EET4_HAEIR